MARWFVLLLEVIKIMGWEVLGPDWLGYQRSQLVVLDVVITISTCSVSEHVIEIVPLPLPRHLSRRKLL